GGASTTSSRPPRGQAGRAGPPSVAAAAPWPSFTSKRSPVGVGRTSAGSPARRLIYTKHPRTTKMPALARPVVVEIIGGSRLEAVGSRGIASATGRPGATVSPSCPAAYGAGKSSAHLERMAEDRLEKVGEEVGLLTGSRRGVMAGMCM